MTRIGFLAQFFLGLGLIGGGILGISILGFGLLGIFFLGLGLSGLGIIGWGLLKLDLHLTRVKVKAPSEKDMFKSWKFWAVMGVIAGVSGLFFYGFTLDPKLVKSPLLNKPAPEFTMPLLGQNKSLSLKDLRGKPVILNFWASWCQACKAEALVLQAAYLRYDKGQQKIRVIGVAIQDKPKDAIAFAKRYGKTYTLGLDNEAGDISLSYGLYGVPETFFIDGKGIIRFKHVGAVTTEIIKKRVEKMLEEKGN